MKHTFYKMGKIANRASIDVDAGLPVVLTTPAIDSYNDSVNPLGADITTRAHKGRFPLLMNHDSKVKSVVGDVGDLKVSKEGVEGVIYMAAAGTSEEVDVARSLMSQGLTPFVSIGFLADMEECEPLDPEEPWGGYRINKWQLVEVSITPTPANPEARLKGINVDPSQRKVLSALAHTSSAVLCTRSIYDQAAVSKSQASGTPSKLHDSTRSTVMSLADKIKAKQQEIVRTKDQIAEITNSLDDTGAMSDEQSEALADLTTKLERHSAHLRTLEGAERVQAAASGGSGSAQPERTEQVPMIQARSRTPGHMKAVNAVACFIKGLVTNSDPLAIARQEFPDIPEMEMLVRAATAPASTTGATWATNLIQETWGPLIELMYGMTIYGKIPGLRLPMEGKVNFPRQDGRGNLAGGFVAEGNPIPVKSGSIGTTSIQPHTLAVISSFTKALMRRSIPSIQGLVQQQIMSDTAETLDTLFLDAVARTAGTRPAGLRDATETGAGNINACTNVATGAGNATVKEINTDSRALLGRVWAVKGQGGVWVMNPAQRLALAHKQDGTTGHFAFADEIAMGKFQGFPILESTNVTAGIVAFIADQSIVFGAEGAPYFEQSEQATLHFESASPLAVGTAGTPNTVAAPVINLFQNDLVAVKGMWPCDWRIVRQGAVQVLTGADAW